MQTSSIRQPIMIDTLSQLDKGDKLNLESRFEIQNKDETYLSHQYAVPIRRHQVEEAKAAHSTNFQASFTLLKCFIGAGILALPYSFHQVGMIPAILTLTFVGIMTYYCMSLLMQVADAKKGTRLETMAYDVLGTWGMYAVEITVSLHQFGSSTASLMLATKFLNYLFCNLGFDVLCGTKSLQVLVCLLVVVPLSTINNMHWFYIPSIASSTLALTGIATQLSYDLDIIQSNPEVQRSFLENFTSMEISNLPMFIGVAVYMFEGVGTFFNIRAAMARPSDFPILLKYQMFVVVLLYILFASLCYLALGANIPGIVIFALPVRGWYIWIVGLYAVAVLMGYPLRLFPLLKILENSNFLKYRIFDQKLQTINWALRYGVRFILIILMLIIVFTAKSLNTLLSFIGSCISVFLAFILPLLMYNAYFASTISRSRKRFNQVLLCIGLTMGVVGAVVSFADMVGLRQGSGGGGH